MHDFPELLEKLARIPDSARVFDTTAAEAFKRYGINPDTLDELAQLGFPASGKDSERLYESSDLINLSLHLENGPVYRARKRYWPAALKKLDGYEKVGYRLNYLAKCPDSRQATCSFRLLTPDLGYVERRRTPQEFGFLYSTEFFLASVWPDLSAAACELIESFSHLELFWLPETLSRNSKFMLQSGLANCGGAAWLLLAEGKRRGILVRPASGIILTPPFGAMHHWVEVDVDGLPVPIDPLMVRTLLRRGALDANRWRPSRSLGGVLCKLAPRLGLESIVEHNGGHIPASFPLSYLEGRKSHRL